MHTMLYTSSDPGLERLRLHLGVGQVVNYPARRPHHDVRALAQGHSLCTCVLFKPKLVP